MKQHIIKASLFLCIFTLLQGEKRSAQISDATLIQTVFVDLLGEEYHYTLADPKIILRDGIAIDGSSVPGYQSIKASDIFLAPDRNTLTFLPTTTSASDKVARVMCNVHTTNGNPHIACTRSLLARTCDAAKTQGYEMLCSCELEFFLIAQQNKHVDTKSYCAAETPTPPVKITHTILKRLKAVDLKPEKTHHEVAPGQYEITLACQTALEAADAIMLAKRIIYDTALEAGYKATFLPKPFSGVNGSGMHTNYSIRSTKTGENLFYDSTQPSGLSTFAQQFISGNLAIIDALTAIANPTINSYKRLVPGYEAPVFVAWGPKNRSTLLRIPAIMPNQPHTMRAELRSPDALANPYLLFACLLKSGLDGVSQNMPAQTPVTEDLFSLPLATVKANGILSLPTSLADAVDRFTHSSFMNDFLGADVVEAYASLKADEIRDWALAVTDWELRRYDTC